MPRAKTTQQKLIDANADGSHQKQRTVPADFVTIMARHVDGKEAGELVAHQAALDFDKKSGGELAMVDMQFAGTDKEFQTYQSHLDQLQEKQKNTPQQTRCAPPDTEKPRGFFSMQLRDLFSVLLLTPVLFAVMTLGASNVYATLMSSGEPVFLESPWLAVSLSMLMPAATTAFKFISSFFKYTGTKKKFALFIYCLTLLNVLAWSIAFALNYSGVSGDINWDALTTGSNNYGSILVWSQLSAEILIGASLFLALEDIFLKYNPENFAKSTEYEMAEQAVTEFVKSYEPLVKRHTDLFKRLSALRAEKEAYINEQLALLKALRSRF